MKTLKSDIKIQGTGLMTAVPVELNIFPSDKKGIRFYVNDDCIEVDVDNVISTEHCVILGNSNNPKSAKVTLAEHLIAACAITEIDALDVCFVNPQKPNFLVGKFIQNAYEIPIFDGSAKVWTEEFNKAGYKGESIEVEPISETYTFQKGKSHIVLMPSDEPTKITYSVCYDHPDLKNRFATLNLDENLNEIIEARTFGYFRDLKKFQALGFSKGVTKENTVGLTDDGGYTTELRSEFEPIKHKILD